VHRKRREKALTRREAAAVAAQFDADRADGIWTFIPVNAAIIRRVCEAFAALPVSTALRAADAIHCASAAAYGVDRIYSNDRHVLEASSHFKLTGVDVTAP
jgi:predicted nucleic acid-binding protein